VRGITSELDSKALYAEPPANAFVNFFRDTLDHDTHSRTGTGSSWRFRMHNDTPTAIQRLLVLLRIVFRDFTPLTT
jgi:hypothetical protein